MDTKLLRTGDSLYEKTENEEIYISIKCLIKSGLKMFIQFLIFLSMFILDLSES